NTKLQDFPIADAPRRVGLNSLGIGGTNAFAVLEETPPMPVVERPASQPTPCVLTLSAKSAPALLARVEQLLDWLRDNPEAPIADLCYTTNVSRSQFAFRFAAAARSAAELKKQLAAWLQTARKDASSLRASGRAPIAFMYSGQGAQYAGMA